MSNKRIVETVLLVLSALLAAVKVISDKCKASDPYSKT